ncbi:MAG: PhoH family protein [Paracoccus sp. (in: a-proteobacteria)]|uniref:PhoH family protein n=1 Tax=Paracoccus sp. TaxID=267 RepID=UPI0026DF37C5|nr:PhoH family protein [Paracoccus sp. (in: a-proteobacteria)]MDO5622666.1 PhoH family protein [Paracoccus sp. (in: a-proteobacteria)]
MGLTPTTPAAAETLLEFPDNRLLIDLCGPHDRHLARIEEALGVHILRRGNQLAVVGPSDAQAEAAGVLRGLYARLESGRPVELAEVESALRMGVDPVTETVSPSEQLEMFAAGNIELRTRKKTVEPRTDAQKAYVRSLFANELAFGIGPAGTGKTYLAVAAGVTMLINGHVDKIILSRPAVEAGERLGFLPGDMKEKVDPYMQPLYDALNDFLPGKQLQKLMEEKRIEIAPLAFMRGRTLANAFVVLDEAQNATTMQMKMFLTRLGEGSRMVITGDRTQIDLPRGIGSGLVEAERVLKDVPGIGFSYFTAVDVVRHPLVAKIIQAYDRDMELNPHDPQVGPAPRRMPGSRRPAAGDTAEGGADG